MREKIVQYDVCTRNYVRARMLECTRACTYMQSVQLRPVAPFCTCLADAEDGGTTPPSNFKQLRAQPGLFFGPGRALAKPKFYGSSFLVTFS